MALDEVYHVTLDGHVVQHGLSYPRAMRLADDRQRKCDFHIEGTRKRTGEFQVSRCLCLIKEEDALYKQFSRRTVVVRP